MIDPHNHFLPALDDGCVSLDESLVCLRTMVAFGYTRIFCTPHCGSDDFSDLSTAEIAERVRALQGHAAAANIPLELKPGGELRLSADLADMLPANGGGGIPTFGHANRYVLADLWEYDWPRWADDAVRFLQSQHLTVIIAHPERMPAMLADPGLIEHLASLGVLFQGNLGPIAGHDSTPIVALAHRFLKENRYFMVGSDGHRPTHMHHRLAGLKVIRELAGDDVLARLTVHNPERLWSG
jgi:protein-tyrosine phosphatase